jgi:hypothetical protein
MERLVIEFHLDKHDEVAFKVHQLLGRAIGVRDAVMANYRSPTTGGSAKVRTAMDALQDWAYEDYNRLHAQESEQG